MARFPSVEEQLREIQRGVEEIIPENALAERLQRSIETGRPLNVKLGCDPSRPDLHIGHAVVLRKLRQFQDLGHHAILIIGTFTAMIGDPSGRSKTRPALTLDETLEYGKTYVDQAARILDIDKLDIRYNSDWLSPMSFSDVIRLASRYTVARMLERDDFEKRYEGGQPISVHEFLYPLAQAQDSVAIESDIELGGTDQKFNLLVGRTIQEANGQQGQICLTMPLLEGTDGVEKMSKSYDNYIGISEAPEEMYGKALSIPDTLIYRYFELATDVSSEYLESMKTTAVSDPRNAKHDLAHALVRMYHGEAAAARASEHFHKTIVRGELPDDMPEYSWADFGVESIGLLDLMRKTGLTSSNSEGRRLVQQGAVSIDGEKTTDVAAVVDPTRLPMIMKVGKRRFARVIA